MNQNISNDSNHTFTLSSINNRDISDEHAAPNPSYALDLQYAPPKSSVYSQKPFKFSYAQAMKMPLSEKINIFNHKKNSV